MNLVVSGIYVKATGNINNKSFNTPTRKYNSLTAYNKIRDAVINQLHHCIHVNVLYLIIVYKPIVWIFRTEDSLT